MINVVTNYHDNHICDKSRCNLFFKMIYYSRGEIFFNEKSSICNFIQIYFDMVTLVMNISMWE